MEKSQVDLLLTDEFIQFSSQIKEIYEQKKKLKEELKQLYEKFHTDIQGLDNQATELSKAWEMWKSDHVKTAGKSGT